MLRRNFCFGDIPRNAGIFLAAILTLNIHTLLLAQGTKDKPKIKTETRQVSGEVAGISQNFIAVLYDQDSKASYEIALAVDKDARLERVKDIKDIKAGDSVTVRYEETIEIEGKITKVKSRIAKVISFVKAAPKGELEAPAEEAPAAGQP